MVLIDIMSHTISRGLVYTPIERDAGNIWQHPPTAAPRHWSRFRLVEAQKRMENLTPEKQEHLIKILHAVPWAVEMLIGQMVDGFCRQEKTLVVGGSCFRSK